MKIQPILIPIVAVLGLILWQWEGVSNSMYSPKQKLAHFWQNDLKVLEDNKYLPKQWRDIRSIELINNSPSDEDWTSEVRPPISLKPAGSLHLEILFIPWVRKNRYGAMINYHLVDIASKNTLWEFGRTFDIGDAAELTDVKPKKQAEKAQTAKKN